MALALRVLVSTTSIRPATPASAVRAPLLALAVMPRALAAVSVVPVDSTSAQIPVRPAKATAAHAAMRPGGPRRASGLGRDGPQVTAER